MGTNRKYLKKTITEAEVRVRLAELVESYSDRLASALGEEDFGSATHYAGVLRGLKLVLGMASCYFENVESQDETDAALRRVLLRGL